MPTMSPPRMTQETAHQPSPLRGVGRAWVQGLARTTVGGKVLRMAYESYFEAAAATSGCSAAYTRTSPRP